MEKIRQTADFLKQKGITEPEVGIILGTGLSKLIDEMDVKLTVPYEDIPNFPVSTVEFHKGELVYGMLEGRFVLAMHGRFHVYEGYTTQEIVLPIRSMKLLGIKYLLVSNACGAMNTDFRKSELMLLEDHINLLPNPLIGPNIDELGPRFPDMSEPYSREINSKIIEIAERHGITLHKGVYVAVTGPNLETPAEYRWLRTIGADVVGMSTTPEAIAANHMGLPVAAVSVITDECDPDNLEPVDIADLLKSAAIAEKGLIIIFRELVRSL